MATPFHAELVTPERVLFSGDVDEVSMRTDEGEIAFLAAHEDYVAAVDISVVRLSLVGGGSSPGGTGGRSGGTPGGGAGGPGALSAVGPAGAGSGASTGPALAGGPGMPAGTPAGALLAAVHGGFVQVDSSGVVILASVAELAGEIDVARARRALETAGEGSLAAQGGPGAATGAAGQPAAGQQALAGGPALPSGGPAFSAGDGLDPAPGLTNPSPAMLALLEPDAPSVRARRAQVRLEAAGVA